MFHLSFAVMFGVHLFVYQSLFRGKVNEKVGAGVCFSFVFVLFLFCFLFFFGGGVSFLFCFFKDMYSQMP